MPVCMACVPPGGLQVNGLDARAQDPTLHALRTPHAGREILGQPPEPERSFWSGLCMALGPRLRVAVHSMPRHCADQELEQGLVFSCSGGSGISHQT